MFCWLRKKKIFKYAIGDINTNNAQKVEKHLKNCCKCQEYAGIVNKLYNIKASEGQPFLSEVFWRKFDERLDLGLAGKQTVPKNILFEKIKFIPMPLPRFAFSAAVAVCIVLIFVVYFKNINLNITTIAMQDEVLIETALLIEDNTEVYLNGDEDAYIEEVLLQMSLGEA